MKIFERIKPYKRNLLLILMIIISFSCTAYAEIDNSGMLDIVLDRYKRAGIKWKTSIQSHAEWLFWLLALISMVWTFGLMALRKASLEELFSELLKYTVFVGFSWWLLINGSNFAASIIRSFSQMGGEATGLGKQVFPSRIIDIGFDIFFKVIDQYSIMSPITSVVGEIVALIILMILGLIATNMMILLIKAWIIAYAGIIFLGFGGSRWTSDMAFNYYRTILGVSVQIFVMTLLIGIGDDILSEYYKNMSQQFSIKEIAVVLILANTLYLVINEIPPMLAGMISGGSTAAGNPGYKYSDAANVSASAAATTTKATQMAVKGAVGAVKGTIVAAKVGSKVYSKLRNRGSGSSNGSGNNNGSSAYSRAAGHD